MTVLYLTQNGITDHIGRSQVAPYVLGLARLGFNIHVLSAEKPGQEALIDAYQQQFDAAGIRWTRVRYHHRPPVFGQVWTQEMMKWQAWRIARREDIRLVHCRSFPPAVIGHRLKHGLGVRFIFDFRDFYADGGLQKTRGLMKWAYRRMKQLEGPMIRHADKVVCLTEQAREVLTGWYFPEVADAARRFQIIPCCADFAHFDLERVPPPAIAVARDRAGLQPDDCVLLYLGSLGPDYLLPQMLALFRQMLALRPSARFLFVSNNGRELVDAECAMQGIPHDRIRFVSADRNEIPAYLALADLSVVFIRADVSKAGCSPTKLAELFACNVPIIANTGVGDLDAIIDLSRNGSVIVRDFADATLRAAVEQVLAQRETGGVKIRENSRELTLEQGVARYAEVYRELLSNEPKIQASGATPC